MKHGYAEVKTLGFNTPKDEFQNVVGFGVVCKHDCKITVSAGWIENKQREKIFCLRRARTIDVRKLLGKPLRRRTWYYLFIDYTGQSYKFRVSTHPMSMSTMNHTRRICPLLTTWKGKLRHFFTVKDAFTWKTDDKKEFTLTPPAGVNVFISLDK